MSFCLPAPQTLLRHLEMSLPLDFLSFLQNGQPAAAHPPPKWLPYSLSFSSRQKVTLCILMCSRMTSLQSHTFSLKRTLLWFVLFIFFFLLKCGNSQISVSPSASVTPPLLFPSTPPALFFYSGNFMLFMYKRALRTLPHSKTPRESFTIPCFQGLREGKGILFQSI